MPASESKTIVCVLGMHRSGTSLAMRLLNVVGIDVGPEESLVAAGPANPQGFWEHGGIVRLNQQLLKWLGGACLRPPNPSSGWELAHELDVLRTRARQLLQEDFGGLARWGWKDPRSCITLPFWRTVVSPTHYVLCVRDPRDVARSLEHRDRLTAASALHAWALHMRSAILLTAEENRLCLTYEAVVANPTRDLRRLTTFLGLPLTDEGLHDAAQSTVDPALRHHDSRTEPPELQDALVAQGFGAAVDAHQALSSSETDYDTARWFLDRALHLVQPVVEQEARAAAEMWHADRRRGLEEVIGCVPPGESFVLIDRMRSGNQRRHRGPPSSPFPRGRWLLLGAAVG